MQFSRHPCRPHEMLQLHSKNITLWDEHLSKVSEKLSSTEIVNIKSDSHKISWCLEKRIDGGYIRGGESLYIQQTTIESKLTTGPVLTLQ